MRSAGMEIVCDIMMTEAVLISNPQARHPELVMLLNKRIQGCLAATMFQMMQYNIPRSKLSDAFNITPGNRSPTVRVLSKIYEHAHSYISSFVLACTVGKSIGES